MSSNSDESANNATWLTLRLNMFILSKQSIDFFLFYCIIPLNVWV